MFSDRKTLVLTVNPDGAPLKSPFRLANVEKSGKKKNSDLDFGKI